MSDRTPAHRADGAAEVGATGATGATEATEATEATPTQTTSTRRTPDHPRRGWSYAPYADNPGVEGAHADTAHADENDAREKFGGFNWGACFFGWLVAIAVAILLTSILGAIVAGVGSSTSVTQSEAQRQAGHIGLAAAIVLVLVLAIGYYLGGYVAGRMSRFDGARQGLGVWLIGLVVTILAVALGAIFGTQYNVLNRVNLPNLPISTDQLGWGAAITALAVLALTLLASLLGGKSGHRYHDRVDRAAWGR